MQTELNEADIQVGDLIVRIDRRKSEANFHIEYFVDGGPLDGRIRIYYFVGGSDGTPTVVTGNTEFPGTNLTIDGDIAIWWSDLNGLNEDRILVCEGGNVTVQLNEIAP